MADCRSLENFRRSDPTQGSNPCPSAEPSIDPGGAIVATLYQRVLGTRFGDLHPVLSRFHSSEVRIAGRGLFRVVYHPGWFRRMLLFATPFPPAGDGIEVMLEVSPTGVGERWVRSFAGRPLVTWQTHRGDLLLERGGPLCFGLVLDVVAGGMTFRTRRTWFLGVPLPRWMAPTVEAEAIPNGEAWNVAVRLTLPLVGRLLDYEGEVIPQWT